MNLLFSLDDLATIAPVLVEDAGHFGCGAWMVDDSGALVCACGAVLFRVEALEGAAL